MTAPEKLSVLSQAARLLDREGLVWAAGASLLLYSLGIVSDFHDVDLLIRKGDEAAADQILSSLGQPYPRRPQKPYATEVFCEYNIRGLEIDLMCNLAVEHDSGCYVYCFEESHVAERRLLSGCMIPFPYLEDWYLLYQLFPGREEKVRLVEEYLAAGHLNAGRLRRQLEASPIPQHVQQRSERLLRRCTAGT